jgi:membrane carboxypeptidase/penicillin-binding protein PbpC
MVFGENSWLVVPGKTVSVKTGTTDQKRDNWTIGYTPSYVVGVWVGNNDNSPMNPAIASGVTGAAPAWNKIMSFILKGKPDEPPKKPDNVVAVEIDAFGGGLPVPGQPTRSEYFIKGTEPTTPSPIYKKIKISKHDTNKLANNDEIEHGDYETKEYIVFSEDDPVSKDGRNRWQEGIDAWIRQNHSAADWQYYPPKETSDFKYPKESSSPTPAVSLTPTPS